MISCITTTYYTPAMVFVPLSRPISLVALLILGAVGPGLLLPACTTRRGGGGGGDDDDSGPADDDDATSDDDDVGTDDDDVGADDDDVTPFEEATLITFENYGFAMMVVDPVTGAGTHVVDVSPEINICSSVFSRDGTLYVSGFGQLMTFDVCTGLLTTIGTYPGAIAACGISTNDLSNVFGINDETDQLIAIDPTNAQTTPIGDLGVDFGPHGLTWDGIRGEFIAINGLDNRVYSVNPETGSATLMVPLVDFVFEGVGVELDPISGHIYACSQSQLLSIDPDSGVVTIVGNIHSGDCNNLGATLLDIPCL